MDDPDEVPAAAPEGLDDAGEAPDWQSLPISATTPFIPRRGDKTFAPASTGEAASTQLDQLDQSRTALFSALAAGSRHHSSKHHNLALWHPDLARASIENDKVYGSHFAAMGLYEPCHSRVELLPEETLYLLDRGVIELVYQNPDNPALTLPMSVQHAYSAVLGSDSLLMHHYQVYAHLKRLGYTVIRANLSRPRPPLARRRVVDDGHSAASTNALVHFQRLTNNLRTISKDVAKAIQKCLYRLAKFIRWLCTTRENCQGYRHDRPLITRNWWYNYDQIFTALQIIPSGHSNISKNPQQWRETINDSSDTSLRPFFDVYKPITKYRKTDPPPPDFHLAVVDVRKDNFPSKAELDGLFTTIPEDTNLPTAPPKSRSTKTPRSSSPSPATFSKLVMIAMISPLIPISFLIHPHSKLCKLSPSRNNRNNRNFVPIRKAEFGKLKTGTRPVVIALVDNGTISFFSVSQGDFGRWPFMGKGRC